MIKTLLSLFSSNSLFLDVIILALMSIWIEDMYFRKCVLMSASLVLSIRV